MDVRERRRNRDRLGGLVAGGLVLFGVASAVLLFIQGDVTGGLLGIALALTALALVLSTLRHLQAA